MPRASAPVTVHLDLRDADDADGSASARIVPALLDAVATGRLAEGDPVPSSRALATEYGLPRSAVVSAYEELVAAGYLEAVGGSGTRVAGGAQAAARAGAGTRVEAGATARTSGDPATAPPPADPASRPGLIDLRPGRSDPALFDVRAWRRAWRHAASAPISAETPWVHGHPELRAALATHLRRHRGLALGPEEIVVTSGASAAFRALTRAGADARGGRRATVAVEDPGYDRFRQALPGEAHVVALPVDVDGLEPRSVPTGADLVYVTPAHQYPLGGRLPVDRRVRLLARARQIGAVVVEDDYDGEYRYDVPPLPALAALEGARQVVAYVGTASKVLSPGLQIAWLVPPPHLLEATREAVAAERSSPATVAGLALAHLVSTGALARHIARSSRVYASRRAALLTALRHGGFDRIAGVDAGLHVCLLLEPGSDDVAVTERLAESGVLVEPLSRYCLHSPARGLVVGYAGLPRSRAREVAAHLVRACTPDAA